MIEIKQLISSFDKDEYQDFVRFLKNKNKRNDAKNVVFVSFLRNTILSSKEICEKLYNGNSTAFHALRKRLFASLIDFTANTSIKNEISTDMQLIKYLIASRSLLKKGSYKTGLYILDKTEAIANSYQLYAILNEVYFTKIEYANSFEKVDLENLILKFKKNQDQLILENDINIMYAEVKYVLKKLNEKSEVFPLQDIVQPILKKYNLEFSKNLSYKSLFQLIEIINLTAFQTFNYYDSESFLINAYQQIENQHNKQSHSYYKLEILYMVANVLFRIKKFGDSLNYLTKMEELLSGTKKYNTKRFLAKHTLLTSLNFNYINKPLKAIKLLEPYLLKRNLDIDIELDIKLTLIVFYFQQNDLQKSKQLLSKLYHTDKWYSNKNGIIWVIQKNIIAILLHIELDSIHLVSSKLLSFKRSYFKYLKEIKQERVIYFINFIEKFFIDKSIINTEKFLTDIENKLIVSNHKKEDIFMISFYAWLKSKFTNQNLYKTTLDLASKK